MRGQGRPDRRTQSIVREGDLEAKIGAQQGFCQLHSRRRVAEVQLPVVLETVRTVSLFPRMGNENKQGAESNVHLHCCKLGVMLGKPLEIWLGVVKAPKVAVSRHPRRGAMGPAGVRGAGLGPADRGPGR